MKLVKDTDTNNQIKKISDKDAEEAFKLCSYKLPIKTKVVGRRELGV